MFSGRERMADGQDEPAAMLSAVRESDRNVVPYTRSARVWSTVKPVTPSGFDDPVGSRKKWNHRPNGPQRDADQQKSLWERLNRRAVERIEKAFRQAGLPNERIGAAELEYREVGFRPGVALARRYDLPPLKYPRAASAFASRGRSPAPWSSAPVAIAASAFSPPTAPANDAHGPAAHRPPTAVRPPLVPAPIRPGALAHAASWAPYGNLLRRPAFIGVRQAWRFLAHSPWRERRRRPTDGRSRRAGARGRRIEPVRPANIRRPPFGPSGESMFLSSRSPAPSA